MKNIILVAFLCCSAFLLNAQNEWDIRFVLNSLDCASGEACYQLEVKNAAGADWALGDQNYRFFFDGDGMTVTSVSSLLPSSFYSAASIDQNIKISGQGQEAASPLDDIDDNLGFLDFSIIETVKDNPSGAAQLNNTTFTPIAEICVDVAANVLMDGTGNTCLSFYHSRPSTAGGITTQYTILSENNTPGSTIASIGSDYDDLTPADGADACLGLSCSTEASWDIQFELGDLDCETGQACYQVMVKNAGGADWALGDQNYRLFFDGDLMTVDSVTSLLPSAYYGPANIDQNIEVSGQGQEAASPLDDIDDNLGFLDFNIVQTDKGNPSGAVQATETDYVATAKIWVTVDPAVLTDGTGNTCLSFYHSRTSTAGTFTTQHTTITENDEPNSTAVTSGSDYDDLTPADGADACLGLSCSTEASWDIQFELGDLDCETGQACYQVMVKNAGGADWALGDQNYRLFFDGDLMTVDSVTSLLPSAYYGPANIDQNIEVSGQGQEAASPLDDIDDNLGFLDFNIVQTDKGNPSGAVQATETDYVATAKIWVTVDPAVLTDGTGNTCLSFYHSRTSTAGTFTTQHTTITENDEPNSTAVTSGSDYKDLTPGDGMDACLGVQCMSSNQYDLRFTLNYQDCETGDACYNVEIKNTSGADWALGDQNYRIFFDGDLSTVISVTSLLPSTLYNPVVIDQNLKFSGQGQEAASPLDDIDDNLGFLDFNIVQADKSNPSGAVQLKVGEFTEVAQICVNVDPAVLADDSGSTCLAFYHSRPMTAGTFTGQYTTVTENDAAGSTTNAAGAGYDDLTSADGGDACLSVACPDIEEYELRFTLDSLDCEAGEACYHLEIKNADGAAWALGDQNYRLFFDGDYSTVLSVTSLLPSGMYAPAVIDQNLKFSGQGQEAASPLDDIDDNLGFLDFNIVLSDKSNPSGAVQVDTAEFTKVAEICVAVDPAVLSDETGSNCLSFYHSRLSTAGMFTTQYTTITENDAAGSTFGANGAIYGDLTSASSNGDVCLGLACGCNATVCPPVSVTRIQKNP